MVAKKIATKIIVWWQNGGKSLKYIKNASLKGDVKSRKTLILSHL